MALRNWLLAVVAVVLSLVIFELVLRAVVPAAGWDRFGTVQVENHEFSYVATHNSLGYRGPEIAEQAAPGVRRVLFIGDSFVYGTGVARAHTIPSLLERELEQRVGAEFQVVNLGLPDGNTRHYLDTATAFSAFEAEIVLLGFYVDNDVLLYGSDSDPVLLLTLAKRAIATLRDAVFKPCRYDWVYDYDVDPHYQDLACRGRINPHIIKRANRNFPHEQQYYDHMTRQLKQNKEVVGNIKSIRDLFAESRFYVAIFPSKYQVNRAYFSELGKLGFRFKDDQPVSGALQSTLTSMLDRVDIEHIDLLPLFRQSLARQGRKQYFDVDDHFNAFGNAVAATAIAERIEAGLGP